MEHPRFGDLFRYERQRARKTLGEVARHVGVSVPFISDVENGRRKPLKQEHIVAACGLFGISPDQLLTVAATERAEVRFDLSTMSPGKAQAALELQRGGYTDEQWAKALLALKEGKIQ